MKTATALCRENAENLNIEVHRLCSYNRGLKDAQRHELLTQGVSGGIVNILGGGSMEYSE
jgi:hypothetical protein